MTKQCSAFLRRPARQPPLLLLLTTTTTTTTPTTPATPTTTTTTPTTTPYYYYSTTSIIVRAVRASAFRAGSARYARLRFARVPRVLFCAGSARVVAFNFLQKVNILQRKSLLLLLITISSILRLVSFLLHL